ncbi:MAG TPA: PH domain-containing protein [Bacilli bacterium]|nr:PH domain-containing protein [Bacilli bacterium]
MNNCSVYELAKAFKKRYPITVAWRIKQNSAIVEKHLNPGEKVLYVFVGQRNNNPIDIITTSVIAITDKRILIGSKRVLFGYFLISVTPDLFNDLKVHSGIFWGDVAIDTVKELIYVSNLSKSSLDEIETNVTEYVMREKKKYAKLDRPKGEY